MPMMLFVYFTLNKNTKIDASITYACFGISLVEISPAGAFLVGLVEYGIIIRFPIKGGSSVQ